MTGLGENLRREREMRGITLDEISHTTKISVRLLEALEGEDFSKLPGGIFTRSFIRSYASYLGLDEEHVISEYEASAPARGDEDLSRFGTNHNRNKSKPPIVPWAIAVLLLATGYGIFRYGHRSTEIPVSFGNPSPSAAAQPSPSGHLPEVLAPDAAKGSSPDAVTSDSTVPAAGPAANGASPSPGIKADASQNNADRAGVGAAAATQPASGDAPAKGPDAGLASAAPSRSSSQSSALSTASAAAAGNLVLQIAATQRVWVAVDADGKNVFERVLDPAQQRTLMAKNYFDVTTGNAQGTVLTLNGITLKPLGRNGEVKTLHLTRDDLRNRTQ
ncbi:MAG: helix-turn-helix domain-containing protein [Terriglobia bacterium]